MRYWYIWLFIFIIAIFKLFRPQIKGFLGEKTVSALLSLLDPTKYMIIDNLLVAVSNKTSQIDHVVVSNYGIFVIETKNYKGWIVGSENDDYWTQVIYRRKERLYNPIKQNYGHITALKEVLTDYPGVRYIPIIVFTTKADLKIRTTSDVIYTIDLISTIKEYNDTCISDELKVQLYEKIVQSNINHADARKHHIETIKHAEADKNFKIATNICPRCGGSLVKRKGKYGDFIGCGNYPRCRYILK